MPTVVRVLVKEMREGNRQLEIILFLALAGMADEFEGSIPTLVSRLRVAFYRLNGLGLALGPRDLATLIAFAGYSYEQTVGIEEFLSPHERLLRCSFMAIRQEDFPQVEEVHSVAA